MASPPSHESRKQYLSLFILHLCGREEQHNLGNILVFCHFNGEIKTRTFKHFFILPARCGPFAFRSNCNVNVYVLWQLNWIKLLLFFLPLEMFIIGKLGHKYIIVSQVVYLILLNKNIVIIVRITKLFFLQMLLKKDIISVFNINILKNGKTVPTPERFNLFNVV